MRYRWAGAVLLVCGSACGTDAPLASDAVAHVRLPINHHVNDLLTFQVRTKP
jgi:hypothetical protein